jgi:hypothetical protein
VQAPKIPSRPDVIVVALLALIAGALNFHLAAQVPDNIAKEETIDFWLDADSGRIFNNMTDRHSDEARTTALHPLFSLPAVAGVSIIRAAMGIPPLPAVRLFLSMLAGLAVSGFYLLLRFIGCLVLDATCFALLMLVSAGTLLWFPIPETFSFSGLTVSLGLLMVVLGWQPVAPGEKPWRQNLALVLASVLTVAGTITNWLIGVCGALATRSPRRIVGVTAVALVCVGVLYGAQKKLCPTATLFFRNPVGVVEKQTKHMRPKVTGGPLPVARAVFLNSVVMPKVQAIDHPVWANRLMLSVQRSPLFSGGPLAVPATLLWILVLGIGVGSALFMREHLMLRLLLGVALMAQVAVHLVYGTETFLYAAHFVPLVLLLAAMGTFTRLRPVVLGAVVALVILAGANNLTAFAYVNRSYTSLAQYATAPTGP